MIPKNAPEGAFTKLFSLSPEMKRGLTDPSILEKTTDSAAVEPAAIHKKSDNSNGYGADTAEPVRPGNKRVQPGRTAPTTAASVTPVQPVEPQSSSSLLFKNNYSNGVAPVGLVEPSHVPFHHGSTFGRAGERSEFIEGDASVVLTEKECDVYRIICGLCDGETAGSDIVSSASISVMLNAKYSPVAVKKALQNLEAKGVISSVIVKNAAGQGKSFALGNVRVMTQEEQRRSRLAAVTMVQQLELEGWGPLLQRRSLVPYLELMGLEPLQDHLDAALAAIDDLRRRGRPVGNRLAWLFSSLQKGYVNPPDGFKTRRQLREDEAARKSSALIKEMEAAEEEKEEKVLTEFRDSLTDERRTEVDREAERRAKDAAGPSGLGYRIWLDMKRQEVMLEMMRDTVGDGH